MASGRRVRASGPYFEELERGSIYEAPAMTITSGHAALHQAVAGDRRQLPLDSELSAEVTGIQEALIHPNLVCDVAIGQSTEPTQRVVGNLFYRGMVLLQPVFRGDTLKTRTEIISLKQNRRRAGARATGLAVLRVRTVNQRDEKVLDFFRCAMIPLRDPSSETGHNDSFEAIPSELDMEHVQAAVPADWNYGLLHSRVAPAGTQEPETTFEIEGRETVTAAPELARMTLNLAMTHRDAGAGTRGRRLVYGGHTISIAAAHAATVLPNLATIVAWRSCEHSAPVFEGDILNTEVTIVAKTALDHVDATLVDLRAIVHADRGNAGNPEQVLAWEFLGVLA
jgi:2-methylfumaryl-CoA hydratase